MFMKHLLGARPWGWREDGTNSFCHHGLHRMGYFCLHLSQVGWAVQCVCSMLPACAAFLSAHCTGAPWGPARGLRCCSPRHGGGALHRRLQTSDYGKLSVNNCGHLEANYPHPSPPLPCTRLPSLLPETHTASLIPLED